MAPRTVELDIDAVGARGDGIARLDQDAVYVPFTVAGDRVLARIEGRRGDGLVARLIDVLVPGPGRVGPPCPHFGPCGGCAVQHMSAETYADWKRGLLLEALSRHGLDHAEVGPLVRVPDRARRRVAFAYSTGRGGLSIGFNGRNSHDVIDLGQCGLLHPALVGILPRLRALLPQVVPAHGGGDVVVAVTDGGLDMVIEGEARLDLFDRERLAAFAEDADLARLHWRRPGAGGPDLVARRRPATITFGDVPVEPPPGAFTQPSREGEAAIAHRILGAVPTGAGILDLFAGCGSFSLPLSRLGPVHAVEGEKAAITALDEAARRARLPLTTEHRDLARRPLASHELARFDVVVLDPPRAGAAAQVAELAAKNAPAGPGVVVMVSCNPATLARDLRTLVDGGWRLGEVAAIDQFPWSAHLEAVAVLRR